MAEIGLPQIEFRYWAGIFAPAGTPPDTVRRLEAEIKRVVMLPEVAAQMAAIQVSPTSSSSEELAQLMATDLARWSAVAESARMKLPD
jgi:tripartite-type tricarboxylate transporter receptor subunit TctC